MRILLLLGTVLLLFHDDIKVLAQPPTFTATYFCDGYDLHITGSVTGGTLEEVYPEGKKTECVNKITVNANKMTGALGTGDAADCGYVEVTDNGVTLRRVTLYFVEMANVVQVSDAKATFECKSDSKPTATMKAEFTAITGDPQAVVTPVADIGVGFKVIDALKNNNAVTLADVAGAAVKAAAAVGDLLLFAGSLDTSNTLKEFKIVSCFLTPKDSDTPKILLIDADGCPDTTNKIFKTDAEKHKTPSATPADNPNPYVYISPPFKIPKFTENAKATATCTIEACVGTADAGCDLPAACNGGGGRRKRAVGQSSNSTVIVQSSIRILGLESYGLGTRTSEQSISNCLGHVSFISVVAILAVLLVVSLAVSVFFCSKLIRQNNNNQQKEAYPNPAYKA